MSEKLCLQWNDFKENINSAFGRLRDDKEFTDVTLACEDGQQMEAHKVILAASSPFFDNVLQKTKHPRPMIYFKGFQSQDLLAILDFLYFGEASVFQENLDSFLALAEELKLKGLTGQTASDVVDEKEKYTNLPPVKNTQNMFATSTIFNEPVPKVHAVENASSAPVFPNQFRCDLEALDEKVKSMMEKRENFSGNQENGTSAPKQETTFMCKVCGKEGRATHISNHIETKHLEGISIPCSLCGKRFSSRNALVIHKTLNH